MSTAASLPLAPSLSRTLVPRRDLAPFIVAHDARVYHLAQTDAEGFNEAVSLCRQVAQNPAGGSYRSGRARPVGAWATPNAYRCCSVCAAVAQAQDEEELSRPAKLLAMLLKKARELSEDRLWGAAHYQGGDWRKQAGREAAKLELDLRIRRRLAGREWAA